MYIEKSELVNYKHVEKEYDFKLNDEDVKKIKDIISFDSAKVTAKADYVSDLAIVKINIKGKMVLRSTRTLNPVDFNFNETEEITYSFYKDPELDDDSIIFLDDDKIDLDEEVISLIITSIPIKIIGKDEPENFSSDSWEVISEEQYKNKKSDKKDPRFAELDSFFDDEDK